MCLYFHLIYFASQTANAVVECAVNIKNTTAFMLMTINRCLDYTKVAHFFPLEIDKCLIVFYRPQKVWL